MGPPTQIPDKVLNHFYFMAASLYFYQQKIFIKMNAKQKVTLECPMSTTSDAQWSNSEL